MIYNFYIKNNNLIHSLLHVLTCVNTDFAARTCLYLRPDLRHNEKIAQGVNFMETIVQRSLSDGTLRYRAEIRVNRKGLPVYKEVRLLAQSALLKSG